MTFTGGNSSIIKTGVRYAVAGRKRFGDRPNRGQWRTAESERHWSLVACWWQRPDVLGGTGTINPVGTATNGNQLVQINGTVSPGLSPNTLTINGPVSFGSAAILNYELNGGNTTVGGGINDLITGSPI